MIVDTKQGGKILKLVILRCPYDSLRIPEAQGLFAQLMAMKIEGYRKEYPYGILPVDTTDFFGDHYLVCSKEKDGKLVPLIGAKSTFSDRCPKFRLEFPFMNYLKQNAPPEFFESAAVIFDRNKSSEKRLSYDSGYTISKEARSNPILKNIVKELFSAIHVLFHSEIAKTDEILSMTATRFKVDRLFEFWGYHRLQSVEGGNLPEISLPSHYGQLAVCMHMRGGFSAQALEAAEKYRALWEDRIVFEADESRGESGDSGELTAAKAA